MVYIPDPLEILERIEERAMDRIENVGGVEYYPCDECGELTLLDEVVCIDPFGAMGVCAACFDKQRLRTEEER